MIDAKFRVLVGCFLLSWTSSIARAGSDPADRKLLADATALVNLRCSAGKPFELMAEFTAQTAKPRQGYITVRWAAKDLWSEDILAGDYSEHDVRKGDSLYIDRNAAVTPVFVRDIRDLLSPLCADSTSWKLHGNTPRTFGGVQTRCLKATLPNQQTEHICIDPRTDELRSIMVPEHSPPQEDLFSAYEPFGTFSFPRQLQRSWGGKSTLDLKVVALQEKSFEAETFTPRPGSIVRRECENKVPPKVLNGYAPSYPMEAHDRHLEGQVALAITVLANGSIDNVQFIQRAGAGLDEAAKDAVNHYKFQPAMCGSEPIADDITVEIEFRLR
jgi:TonB family protein